VPIAAVEGRDIEIPIGAAVQCTNGPGGRSRHVVINPITEQVTHLVVQERQPPHAERLVPVRFVKTTTDEQIQLTCSHSRCRADIGRSGEQCCANGRAPEKVSKMARVSAKCIAFGMLFAPLLHATVLY
jgi:hypothetical protein